MDQVSIKLENCYGIKKLESTFDFSNSKVNAIYAKNGLMKTSFAKTFKMLQEGKKEEIHDAIFESTPVIVDVKIDNIDIKKEEIFVVKSFESQYESSSVADLLLNKELKYRLAEVLELKDKFLKALENKSGLKIVKTLLGKKVYELEPQIITDLCFEEKSLLLSLDRIEIESLEYEFSDIMYASIFDDSVLKKIHSTKFQDKIKEFMNKSDEIYEEYSFLEKGKFTLPKLKDIKKSCEKNNFFVKDNKIIFNDDSRISSLQELNEVISQIDTQLQETKEFKEIEKLLSDAKGTILKDIIENHPDIIKYLDKNKLDEFKVRLWISYIQSEKIKFEQLKESYHNLEDEIKKADFRKSPWKKALDIFNSRFSVPFKMEISNLKSSIIGESVPRIIFSFCKDGNDDNLNKDNWKNINRNELESRDTLSQGERRVLYLLNIIFDIEKRRIDSGRTVFIIDDIADSFDYKNKYAIIEYLQEIAQEDKFYMIILSHNFDFYRTVTNRLDMKRNNKFIANSTINGVEIKQEKYQSQPFIAWKKDLNEKNIIALIPFVRNLIEYGVEKQVNDFSQIDDDYILLTNILHDKKDTAQITFSTLKKIYKEYVGENNFTSNIADTDIVYKKILEIADTITFMDIDLENKIVLAIAIRIRAEKFMKKQIKASSVTFVWKQGKTSKQGDKGVFLNHIEEKGNQTRELFNGYIQIGSEENVKLLDCVNIMTPESIHLNSFMYEPILDMDIVELISLYNRVKQLDTITQY